MLHDNYQMYMVYVQKACSQLHFSVIDIDTTCTAQVVSVIFIAFNSACYYIPQSYALVWFITFRLILLRHHDQLLAGCIVSMHTVHLGTKSLQGS